jgi:hypothetical protein
MTIYSCGNCKKIFDDSLQNENDDSNKIYCEYILGSKESQKNSIMYCASCFQFATYALFQLFSTLSETLEKFVPEQENKLKIKEIIRTSFMKKCTLIKVEDIEC